MPSACAELDLSLLLTCKDSVNVVVLVHDRGLVDVVLVMPSSTVGGREMEMWWYWQTLLSLDTCLIPHHSHSVIAPVCGQSVLL
jgi:hypothetical protein